MRKPRLTSATDHSYTVQEHRPCVIAFEGGICSGKSTIVRILDEAGIGVRVPEYLDFARPPDIHRIANYRPRERSRFFLTLDGSRSPPHDASRTLLLDRSFLTIFAFEYACARTRRNRKDMSVIHNINRLPLIIPQSIFFLNVRYTERRRRCAVRDTAVLPFLLHERFNQAIAEFFEELRPAVDLHVVSTTGVPLPEIAYICASQAASLRTRGAPTRSTIRRRIERAFEALK